MRVFTRANGGNVAISFALMIGVMLGGVGVALDYAIAVKRKWRLDGALDAALLAATNAASAAERAGNSKWSTVGQDVATTFMRTHLRADDFSALTTFTANFVKDGREVIGTAAYDAGSPTTIMRLFRIDSVDLASSAKARVDPGNFVDIHFIIDNSASMGLGADAPSQSRLSTAKGTKGVIADNGKSLQTGTTNCQLACHFLSKDQYTVDPAVASGLPAKLRIDVAREALVDSIKSIQAKKLPTDRIRVSIHTFSNSLATVSPISSDLNAAIAKANTITLDKSDQGGGTFLWKSLGQFNAATPRGGDGRSSANRLSFVVLFTDGVENDSRMMSAGYVLGRMTYEWSHDHSTADWKETSQNGRIQAVDPARCGELKSKTRANSGNHTVMTVQVQYFLGSEVRIAKPKQTSIIADLKSSIRSSMINCASDPKYAAEAADTANIKSAFKTVVDQILDDQVVYLSH